jgi:hypothetical protein
VTTASAGKRTNAMTLHAAKIQHVEIKLDHVNVMMVLLKTPKKFVSSTLVHQCRVTQKQNVLSQKIRAMILWENANVYRAKSAMELIHASKTLVEMIDTNVGSRLSVRHLERIMVTIMNVFAKMGMFI